MLLETAPHNPDWPSISYIAQAGLIAATHLSSLTFFILILFGHPSILTEYNP